MRNAMLRAAVVTAGLFLATATTAQTSPYPNRPITIIVATTLGTTPDVMIRFLAPRLAQRLGQPIVIDNRAGASGNIGAAAAAKAAPDGYTLLLTAVLFTMTPAFNKSLPFDPAADFEPIGTLAKATLAFVTNPSVAANNMAEYLALARAKPGQSNFGTPGVGTPHHLILEMLKLQEKVDIVHVPYKGTAGMVSGLLSGETSAAFFPVVGALPQAAGGKLKMLAVLSDRRSEYAPSVPTFRESSVDGMSDLDNWMALFAPARTARDITARIHREIMALVVEIAHASRIPVVISMHDIVLAQEYASRVVALKDGEKVFDGAPGTIDLDRIFKGSGAPEGPAAHAAGLAPLTAEGRLT